MKYRHAKVLLLLTLAACANSGTKPTETGESAGSMQEPEMKVAAEALVVKHHVPDAVKKSDLLDEDTLICKKEKVVGSHIPRTVCLSARDRASLQKASQTYMEFDKRAPQPSIPEG